jgi:hypothetical protein
MMREIRNRHHGGRPVSHLRHNLAAAVLTLLFTAPANAAPAGEATAATPANASPANAAAAGAAKAAAPAKPAVVKPTPPKSASARRGGNCQKMAFSVNDYGKEGPTRDALSLLDKHIADWTKQQGIKKYNVGKKDVSCELFLDVGLFDEHTCKATASVCWTK